MLGAVAVGFAALVWASAEYASRVQQEPQAGEAPDVVFLFRDPKPIGSFTLESLDGRTFTAASLKGKVVLVNFWATWCPPCRIEIPDLIRLQETYADDLVVLGVSADEIAPDEVGTFAESVGINYPIAMTSPEIERVFSGVTGLPTTFLLDRDGRVVQKHSGLVPASIVEAEMRVAAGLETSARVEYVDPDRPLGLANAAQVKEIPGVDLAALAPAQRGQALQALNEEGCTCGCGLTVARCRVDDPGCDVSLPRAREIVEKIARGR